MAESEDRGIETEPSPEVREVEPASPAEPIDLSERGYDVFDPSPPEIVNLAPGEVPQPPPDHEAVPTDDEG